MLITFYPGELFKSTAALFDFQLLLFWTAFNPLSLFGNPERSDSKLYTYGVPGVHIELFPVKFAEWTLPSKLFLWAPLNAGGTDKKKQTLPCKLFTVQIKKSKNICCSLCNMNHLISFLWSSARLAGQRAGQRTNQWANQREGTGRRLGKQEKSLQYCLFNLLLLLLLMSKERVYCFYLVLFTVRPGGLFLKCRLKFSG